MTRRRKIGETCWTVSVPAAAARNVMATPRPHSRPSIKPARA